jgi:tetratricopeptide (TPR) repeat protein
VIPPNARDSVSTPSRKTRERVALMNKLPLLRMVVPLFLTDFEERNLAVIGCGIFRGPRLVVDGRVREPNGGKYVLLDNNKKVVVLRLKRRFLDPIPDVEVHGETEEIVPAFRWYEHFWMSISGFLIYFNVPLGVLSALGAYWLNTKAFRSYHATWLKYFATGLISAFAVIFFMVVGLGIVMGAMQFHRWQMESAVNAANLQEIHAAHQAYVPQLKVDSLHPVDHFGYPQKHIDRPALVILLRRMQFQHLTAELQALVTAYNEDFRAENLLAEGFNVFSINDSTLEGIFNAWVTRMPSSYVPYLARAEYLENLGWESRGYGWAKDTPPEQFERMESYFDRAEHDVRSALALQPGLLTGFSLLMRIACARGDQITEQFLSDKASVLCPYSASLRIQHMLNLLPRWGGSYKAMEKFANQSEQFARENPRLKVLRGCIDWDLGRVAEYEAKNEQALDFYSRALTYGRIPVFLKSRASVLRKLKRFPEALSEIRAAIEMDPYNVDLLTEYAVTAYHMDADDEVMRALTTAIQLDPMGRDVLQTKSHIVDDLVAQGFALHKAKDEERAMKFYVRALRYDTENADVYYYRASAYLATGRSMEAMESATRAVTLRPHNLDYYQYLDYILAQRHQWDDRVAIWSRFIAVEPKNGRGYLARSRAYYEKGDFPSALRDAEAACSLGDRDGCEAAGALKRNGVSG